LDQGGGQTLYWFQLQGFTVFGLEPDKRNVELINKKLKDENRCIVGYAEDFETEKKFDIVWMSHVLEHTIRPDILFKKIFDILNEDGFFFVEVPNCQNERILSSSINENPSTFHFTKKSLFELGEHFGYKIIKSNYFFRKRSFIEKSKRGLEKYLKISIQNPPFHFEMINDANIGQDLRILYMKKS